MGKINAFGKHEDSNLKQKSLKLPDKGERVKLSISSCLFQERI
jgi:hypothetical protein